MCSASNLHPAIRILLVCNSKWFCRGENTGQRGYGLWWCYGGVWMVVAASTASSSPRTPRARLAPRHGTLRRLVATRAAEAGFERTNVWRTLH